MPKLTKIVKLIRSGDHKKVGKGLIDAAELAENIDETVVRAVIYALGSKDTRVRQGCLAYLQCLVRDFASEALDAGLMEALGSIPEDDHKCIGSSVSLIHLLMYLQHDLDDVANAVALLSRAIIHDVNADMAMVLACKISDHHVDLIVDELHITEVCKFFWTRGPALVSSLLLATAMCGHVRHLATDVVAMDVVHDLLEIVADRVNVVYVCTFVQQMCKSGYVEEVVDVLNALLVALGDHTSLKQVFKDTGFNRGIFRQYVLITLQHALDQCPRIFWRLRIHLLLGTCLANMDFESVDMVAQLLATYDKLRPYAKNAVAKTLRQTRFPGKLRHRLHEFPTGDRILNVWFPDFAEL